MESQNAVVCCSPTRVGREFQKTPVLKAPCAVPRGITSDFGGHGFRSREGCAGVSSAVPAPLAVVPRVPGPWMFLWLHWGSGGCITELLPSWWFPGSSQSAGWLSAKHKVLQIPQILPNTQVDVGTSDYFCTLHGRWPPASIKDCGFEKLNFCDMFCKSVDRKRWKEKWNKPNPKY